jgi:hypothetical protein
MDAMVAGAAGIMVLGAGACAGAGCRERRVFASSGSRRVFFPNMTYVARAYFFRIKLLLACGCVRLYARPKSTKTISIFF